MSGATPFEPGASLARIDRTPSGYVIDCRGPRVARRYKFTHPGETAEFAILMRDEGEWPLRFGRGADEVRQLVAEIDDKDEGSAA